MSKRLLAVFIAIRKDIIFLYTTLVAPDTETVTRVIIVAMLIYLFSPLDIIADAVPILGQIDDIAIILFGINWVKKSVESTKKKQHNKDKEIIDSNDIISVKHKKSQH